MAAKKKPLTKRKKSAAKKRTKKRAGSPSTKTTKKKGTRKSKKAENPVAFYCGLPTVPEIDLSGITDPDRRELIVTNAKMWANGTQLHYYFFDQQEDGEHITLANGSTQWVSWVGPEEQRQIVRKAFDIWMNIGIGIDFVEVDNRQDAEVRIGFMQGDGSWSYLGKDVLSQAASKRTMNFGWDLKRQPDTAIHEIGHTLGLPHEHQNPHAGIVWNEEAVYAELAATNGWSREKTFNNIIKKIQPDRVQGSSWDSNSVMHYPFARGLIEEPAEFGVSGIQPAPGLSARDKTWVKSFYPPMPNTRLRKLKPFESVELLLAESEQANFVIEPESSREFQMRTFGNSDVVMVLFEDDEGDPRFVAGDDDSGEERNAHLTQRLLSGRRYILRIRLYWTEKSGQTAVMLW